MSWFPLFPLFSSRTGSCSFIPYSPLHSVATSTEENEARFAIRSMINPRSDIVRNDLVVHAPVRLEIFRPAAINNFHANTRSYMVDRSLSNRSASFSIDIGAQTDGFTDWLSFWWSSIVDRSAVIMEINCRRNSLTLAKRSRYELIINQPASGHASVPAF